MPHSHHHSHRSDKRKKRHHKRKHQHKKYNAVVEYRGLNRKTNFVKNQRNLIRKIRAYVKKNSWEKRSSVPRELVSYIRNLPPIHQVNGDIFESICLLGHVLSKECREGLTEPRNTVKIVAEHNKVRTIIADPLKIDSDIYITALVEREYDKHRKLTDRENEYRRIIQERSAVLTATLGQKKVDTIRHFAIDVAKAAITLQSAKVGVNHDKDKDFGTHRHIFAILGPHTGNYGDVFIVFNREIMLHPDSNFSTTAATTYGQSANAYSRQPWLTDPVEEKKRIKCFHSNKLHCSVPGYEYAAAYALMASTGLHKKTTNVTLKEVQKWWRAQNPHFVLEAHLPSYVSIDNIARVYMPKSVFESYSDDLRKSIRHFFGRSLIITKHNVDQSNRDNLGDLTDPNSRVSYQKYVNDKLTKKFSHRKKKSSRRERGTVVTMSQSEFTRHVRLPMTIPQAHSQYLRLSKKKNINRSSQTTTYVYWQAMFGDMMLTVSNEPIHLRTQNQRKLQCLICYIAPIPFSSAHYSQESYSYLTNGNPLEHKMNIHRRQYKVGSKKFHHHCNFNEYIAYRLKIERHIGRVTLSRTGPNSRHNKEKLVYKFKKSELDLNKLIYVHVSANEHPVPIRNLIVGFKGARRSHHSSNKRGRDSTSQPKRKRRHSAPSTNRTRGLRHSSRHRHRRNSAPPTNHTRDLRHSSRHRHRRSSTASTKHVRGPHHSSKHRHRRSSTASTNHVRGLHHSSRHRHRRTSSVHHSRPRTSSLPSIHGQHRSRFSSTSPRSRSKSTGRNSRHSSGTRSRRSISHRKSKTGHHLNKHHHQPRKHHSR